MDKNSLIFQIPLQKTEPQPVFVGPDAKTDDIDFSETSEKPLSLFEELTAIAEEIEQCRKNSLI